MVNDYDFLSELRARKARRQKPELPAEDAQTVPTEGLDRKTHAESSQIQAASGEVPDRATTQDREPEDLGGLDPELELEPQVTDRLADLKNRVEAAATTALKTDSPMDQAGAWKTLGDDLTDTIHELGNRLFADPERASEPARSACQKITIGILDKLDARIDAVVSAWVRAVDGTVLSEEVPHIATMMLRDALSAAIVQTQTVVDAVSELTDRLAAEQPALADPWKALTHDLQERLAAIAAAAEESGQPGTTAHTLARARAEAHAQLAAMTPEERRKAARESAIRRMNPADAAAAREADTASRVVGQWNTVGRDLLERYPLFAAIVNSGHRPITELLRVAGLGKKTTSNRINPDGSTTKLVSEQLPTLAAVVETADGIDLEFEPLRGQSVSTWQSALGVLGVEMGYESLTATQRGQRFVIATNDAPVLEPPKILARPLPEPFDPVHGRSYLGQNGQGDDIWIIWADKAGAVFGGVPGCGKTGSLLPLIAGLAGQAEIHVFDGKGEHDWDPLKPILRSFDASGEIDGPMLTRLTRIEELRRTRGQAIYEATGESNYWKIPAELRKKLDLFPVFVVIDECQTWLDKKEAANKEEAAITADVTRLITRFVKKGRSAGMITILATQKPEVESLPGPIRDMCAIKVCYQTTTDAQAKTVLAALPPIGPFRPNNIADTEKGRCVMKVGKGFELVQSVFVAPKDIATAMADKNPVPDQLIVATQLLKG